MSLHTHDWSPRRYRPAGVTPLEVWNLPVLGHELWELLGAPSLDAARWTGVPEERLANTLMPPLVVALETLARRHEVDAIWLSGGLACLEDFGPRLEEATVGLGRPVHVAPEPRFAPVQAGLRVLERAGARRPLALDVGQTSIKCRGLGGSHVFERDITALPRLLIGAPRPEDGSHVVAAVRFIADALRANLAPDDYVTPDALCLALPCPLDEALRPGGCTYGWEGHASLVRDILTEADVLPSGVGDVLVMNDAELAAEAAREDVRLTHHRRILCLTLGFGPGGALLERV
ncbi:ROK family protein [Myxococcus sp. K15C18031901]|uniref:ROK family protein n=1 Tax=Myxococcus dinghuensis TaxID=2906761 RepID=UPI0020A70812|nr:ROK family protein [Myxococcus dinghuensis]MCP3099108.1 ROK family protein [Myxococcus dinghuensis]